MITIQELKRREPRLDRFYNHIEADRSASLDNLPEYKATLSGLVGWYSTSTDPALITPEAWDVAYHELVKLLEGMRKNA